MLDLPERLQKKIIPEPNSGCWLWTGALTHDGYGRIRVQGKQKLIHRVVFEFYKGSILKELQLDHLCRVRCCANPEHLEMVTCAQNIQRGNTGLNHSSKTHCPQGHPYTEENTRYWFGRGVRARYCRVCRRIDQRQRNQKRKGL